MAARRRSPRASPDAATGVDHLAAAAAAVAAVQVGGGSLQEHRLQAQVAGIVDAGPPTEEQLLTELFPLQAPQATPFRLPSNNRMRAYFPEDTGEYNPEHAEDDALDEGDDDGSDIEDEEVRLLSAGRREYEEQLDDEADDVVLEEEEDEEAEEEEPEQRPTTPRTDSDHNPLKVSYHQVPEIIRTAGRRRCARRTEVRNC